MQIFERDGKFNFVDDNNVFVGFDNQQSCCESFGYLLTSEIPKSENTESEFKETDFPDWNFDTSFFQDGIDGFEEHPQPDGGGEVVFRLAKNEKQMFLTLYNHHNGYYSHGFEMTVGGKVVKQGSL